MILFALLSTRKITFYKSPFTPYRQHVNHAVQKPCLELVQRRTTKSPESAKSPTSHFYYGRRDCRSPIFQMLYLPLRDKIDPSDDRFEDRGKTLYIYIKSKNITLV